MFSPIEHIAWGEIRYLGLVLYPQYPIAELFVDFAAPQQKVVIECDGAAYHDKDQDAERDERLRKRGWTVYRIPGKDFMRHELNIDSFLYDLDQAYAYDGGDRDGSSSMVLIEQTIDLLAGSYCGAFLAIAYVHFGKDLLPNSMSNALVSIAEKYRSVTGVKNA
jgi:very-short-patch-repair endonuclease